MRRQDTHLWFFCCLLFPHALFAFCTLRWDIIHHKKPRQIVMPPFHWATTAVCIDFILGASTLAWNTCLICHKITRFNVECLILCQLTTEQPLESSQVALEDPLHLPLVILELVWQQLQMLHGAADVHAREYVTVPATWTMFTLGKMSQYLQHGQCSCSGICHSTCNMDTVHAREYVTVPATWTMFALGNMSQYLQHGQCSRSVICHSTCNMDNVRALEYVTVPATWTMFTLGNMSQYLQHGQCSRSGICHSTCNMDNVHTLEYVTVPATWTMFMLVKALEQNKRSAQK